MAQKIPEIAPRKPRPGYKRVVIGHKPIPMQATHLPGQNPRCPRCWLSHPSAGHRCIKKIDREQPTRNPSPPMLFQPIYEWVKV